MSRPAGRLLLTTPNRRSHLVTRRPLSFLNALVGHVKLRSNPMFSPVTFPEKLGAPSVRSGFNRDRGGARKELAAVVVAPVLRGNPDSRVGEEPSGTIFIHNG